MSRGGGRLFYQFVMACEAYRATRVVRNSKSVVGLSLDAPRVAAEVRTRTVLYPELKYTLKLSQSSQPSKVQRAD